MMLFIKRNPDVAFRIFAEEAIIYSTFDNKFHHLNEIGAKIWELSGSWVSVRNIALLICKTYNVKRANAQSDIHAFIKRMSKAKLLLTKQKC